MGLQPPVLPVLRTCKYLRLCELRFRTHPLFLATILGGNHFRDNQVAVNPYGKSPNMTHDSRVAFIIRYMAALPVPLPNLVPGVALPPAPQHPPTDVDFEHSLKYIQLIHQALGEKYDILFTLLLTVSSEWNCDANRPSQCPYLLFNGSKRSGGYG